MGLYRSAVLASVLCLTAPLAGGEEGETWLFDTHTPGLCSPTGAPDGGCPAGETVRIRVVTVAHGFVRPWHLAFLPGGNDMLVTELPGALRIVRNGKLDPQPIAGWPDASLESRSLNSVVLHPLQAERRESLLVPLDARVRDVRQGPDGNIYVLVERDQQFGPGSARLTPNGSLLRIEPAG